MRGCSLMAVNMSGMESPWKGRHPHTHTYRHTPAAHTSTCQATQYPQPCLNLSKHWRKEAQACVPIHTCPYTESYIPRYVAYGHAVSSWCIACMQSRSEQTSPLA